MARAIKTQLAETAAREAAVLARLQVKVPDGKQLFLLEFGLELGAVAKKTKAFFEVRVKSEYGRLGQRELVYRHPLQRIVRHKEGWKRPLDTWIPKGKAGQTVLQSLISHLFCLYPVPLFLVQHWAKGEPQTLEQGRRTFDPMEDIGYQILLSVGQGDSFAKMVAKGHYKQSKKGLPLDILFPPLTKRQCHLFLTQPSGLSVMAAVRHAQVQSFGGSRLLGNEIAAAWPNIHPVDEAFIAGTIQWFCNQGMFDVTKVRPMVDYIRHCRMQNANGAQWTLSGRTVTTILQGMDAWHQELKQQKVTQANNWNPSGIMPYNQGPNPTAEHRPWTCVEICSTQDLHAEGRAMHHCVGSYSSRASSGQISIWSLRHHGERRLTVEVSSRRTIDQARGLLNAKPSPVELEQLRRWASQAGLQLSSYL